MDGVPDVQVTDFEATTAINATVNNTNELRFFSALAFHLAFIKHLIWLFI